MVLTRILISSARKFPNAPALTMKMGFRTVTLTYKQVYDLSRQISLKLAQDGIKKGDKVLLLAPNSPYWICAFWGCMLSGAIVVPLTTQSTPEMVEKIAQQTQARLLFAHQFYHYDPPAGVTRYNVDFIKELVKDFTPEECVPVHADKSDLVEILYTSGTTAEPKGVMLSHTNLFSNIKAASQMTRLVSGKERLLSILPLSHIFEQAGGFLLAYYYGAHIIYAHSPAAIKELLCKYRITKMMAVPEFLKIMMSKIETAVEEKGKKQIFEKLLRWSEKIKRPWISRLLFRSVHKQFGGKLDTIVSGGAPLDESLERKWNALGVVVFQGYGLTETSPLVSSNTYEERRFGSVGKIAPGVTVRIASDGEIQVKGDNVFSGYFKNEEKTKEAFTDDGFFKTEDIGELDDDGFLFIKGRKGYMILGPGGQNVFPEDIEEVINLQVDLIHKLDGVKDCCVVGLEKPSGMVEIHAVFLLDETARKNGHEVCARLVEQANKTLASYQQITGFSVWSDDDFPRSATKKVKKNVVKNVLLQRAGQQEITTEAKGPLIALLAQVTGIEKQQISPTTKLSELHFDSLMKIEFIARAQEKFGVELDETALTFETTVTQIETMLREKKPVKALPPLRRWPRSWLARAIRSISLSVLFLFMRIFVKLRVKGLENLQDLPTPFVFMPNHISYIDPMVLVAALPKKFRTKMAFAAGNDVLYNYYKAMVFPAELLFNAFPFPRKEKENVRMGLDYMGQMLDDGFSIAVFPEGRVSPNGKLEPLKRGAGLIAVGMDAYVIPVIITGADSILPYTKMIPRSRGTVTVTFGKPIKFKASDSYIKATEEIERAMRELGGS